ncbi:MAG: NAD(+) synthase [Pontibacterium sp.]
MNTAGVIGHISQWLASYIENSPCKGFVVGVSGGIDSAVSSTLAARTGFPTICLEMPIHQHPDQVSRARKHIDYLKETYPNVSDATVELTQVYESFIAAMPPVQEGEDPEMALVNSRARIRMSTLYYFAALHNSLVVGTGNKVEDFGVGFFTKYGDGGVDLSPIADLVKTEVYALGRELGVNDFILNAPPTDGLWGDDRTDEDQIGASYPELEWAMGFVGDEGDLSDREKEVLAIYRRLHRANQHKMLPIPVCEIPFGLR